MRGLPLWIAAAIAAVALAPGSAHGGTTLCELCPDLTVRNVSYALTDGGRTLVLTATVVNVGTIPSTSTTIAAAATSWTTASAPVVALARGASTDVPIRLAVPDAAHGATSVFTVTVDPDETGNESSYGNNAFTLKVGLAAGNLTAAIATAAVSPDGTALVVSATVSNRGKGSTAPTRVRVAAAWGAVLVDVPELPVAGSVSRTATLPIEDSGRGKTAQLVATVDPDQSVAETSYADNASAPYGIAVAAGNLVVRRLVASPGETAIGFRATVANVGSAPTAPTTVEVAAPDWGPGREATVGLAAGASVDVLLSVPIPDDARGTTPHFTATVDPLHDVAETSYTDNAGTPVEVRIALGNLTLRDVAATVTAGGAAVSVHGLIVDDGDGATAATGLAVAAEGWEGASVRVAALAPSASARFAALIAIPAAYRGRHVVFTVVVDAPEVVREGNEDDNVATAGFDVPAGNLVLASAGVRFADSARRAEVKMRVRNAGAAPTGATRVLVAAEAWPSADGAVPALAPGASVETTVALVVPDAARGHRARFAATVDPDRSVAETSYEDNRAETTAAVPGGPPPPRANLTARIADGRESGTAIVLSVVVANVGAAASEPTRVAAAAPGWRTAAAGVGSIAAGNSSSVRVRLLVPADARGAAVSLLATVDPDESVPESSYADNVSRPFPVAVAGPNLVLTLGKPRVDANATAVTVPLLVRNAGRIAAPGTRAAAFAPGWESGSTAVRPLAPGARTTLAVRLRVPPFARGRTTEIGASVAPVDGDPPQDDRAGPLAVAIPGRAPATADLTTELDPPRSAGGALLIAGSVRNVGTARSSPTEVEIVVRPGEPRALQSAGSGWGSPAVSVPALPPGGSARFARSLAIPRGAAGTTVRVEADVNPRRTAPERNYDNNVSLDRRVPLATPSRHRSLPALLAALAGLAASALAVSLLLRRRLLTLRWERSSESEQRATPCTVCTRYCRRVELELKPSRRKVDHIVLSCERDGVERECEVHGAAVRQLNAAVRAHRRGRPPEHLNTKLAPVAAGLVEEVVRWLGPPGGRGERVSAAASLVGGKLECKFTLYHCVDGPPGPHWEEEREWSKEIEDERTEPAATVPHPSAERELALLLRDLREFLARVDVAGERPPETAPAVRPGG